MYPLKERRLELIVFLVGFEAVLVCLSGSPLIMRFTAIEFRDVPVPIAKLVERSPNACETTLFTGCDTICLVVRYDVLSIE